jgi:hypothetical protein
MSRNDKLNQFDDLIDELQRNDERPSAPRAFKQELRRNLLNQNEKPAFSLANLGRWAGTAVALGVLGFIIVYAWSIMSQPPSAGDPVSVTRPVQPSPESTILPVEPELAASSFRDGPLLNRHALSATQVNPGETLDATLFWEGEIAPNSQVALHLTDASGVLFSQADQPLTAEMTLSLPIPETLADGVYEVVVVRYDAATGVRQDSFLLQEIGVGTAVAPPAQHDPNDVWLISATQHVRTSADDPITLDFTVGYQFEFDEEILLQPIYASTDWESHSTGPHTIRNLGNPIPLANQTGIQTITFTESPEIMRQDVEADIDQLVLVMQLYTRAGTDENGNEIPNILTMLTMSGFVIDMTSTEEITFFSAAETAVSEQELTRTIGDWTVPDYGYAPWVLDEVSAIKLTLAGVEAAHGQYILSYELNGVPAIALAQGLVLNYRWESEPEIVELPWATVELDPIEPPGPAGWIALVRPHQEGIEPQPNISLLVEIPDRELVFQLIEALVRYTPVNDTKNRNYLNIVTLSPPVGSTLNGKTTFTLTVQYNLLSLDTANLVTMLMPYESGPAVMGNDVQTIARGEGEITFSFNFEPLVTNVASNWVLKIRMVDPAEEFPQSALATASPHDNFPDDVYHFEP